MAVVWYRTAAAVLVALGVEVLPAQGAACLPCVDVCLLQCTTPGGQLHSPVRRACQLWQVSCTHVQIWVVQQRLLTWCDAVCSAPAHQHMGKKGTVAVCWHCWRHHDISIGCWVTCPPTFHLGDFQPSSCALPRSSLRHPWCCPVHSSLHRQQRL